MCFLPLRAPETETSLEAYSYSAPPDPQLD